MLNIDKGYGFIKCENREKDLFFHFTQLKNVDFKSLKEGIEVEITDIENGKKGPQAIGVYIINE